MKKIPYISAVFAALLSLHSVSATADQVASFASEPPVIDGTMNDPAWQNGIWYPLDKHILGTVPTPDDFSGRYKVSWDRNFLYILVEFTDDILFDQHADPRHLYWDDDTLEIFLDEDMSGGNHQYNHSAFAYHVALDGQVADMGPQNADGSDNFILLNNHIKSAWKRGSVFPHKITWEVAVKVYAQDFEIALDTSPVTLTEGKELGFMLAYCDNDGSQNREHFMGSHIIEPVNGDKNRGYIDASVFGTLKLTKSGISAQGQ